MLSDEQIEQLGQDTLLEHSDDIRVLDSDEWGAIKTDRAELQAALAETKADNGRLRSLVEAHEEVKQQKDAALAAAKEEGERLRGRIERLTSWLTSIRERASRESAESIATTLKAAAETALAEDAKAALEGGEG